MVTAQPAAPHAHPFPGLQEAGTRRAAHNQNLSPA